MSASLEMKFNMTKGTDEEFHAVLNVLRKIGGSDKETWWGLNEKNHSFTIGNSDFPAIWGEDYLETDPRPYVLFAKAAPKAEWTASSDRCYEVDGTTSEDNASYSCGVLEYGYFDIMSGRIMDYEELCEYVQEQEEYMDSDEGEEDVEDSDELTIDRLEECFADVSRGVRKVLRDKSKLVDAEFAVDVVEASLSLSDEAKALPNKIAYIIKGFFSNGKEPESLDGKSFVITGKLNYFDNRDAMVEFIENNGGRVAGSVSRKTDFLVCNDGDSTSSKAKKAAELGIPVLTEGEFIGRFGFPGEYDEEE